MRESETAWKGLPAISGFRSVAALGREEPTEWVKFTAAFSIISPSLNTLGRAIPVVVGIGMRENLALGSCRSTKLQMVS